MVYILTVIRALPAQNLVPNPGFDILTECPFEQGQISFAAPWVSASSGSPDLFNECSNSQFIKVPNAGRWIDSHQIPRSGTGHAQILVYNNNNSASGSPGNSEYIETPLSVPMQEGKMYYIEFYVSPDFTPIQHFGYTDAVGLALSDTFYYREIRAMEALPLEPVIENRGRVIKDTAGWTRISGCYIAKGGEKYAIIGNFRSTEETIVEFENPTFPFINFFYIEDVLISLFDPLPDTILLCEGAPFQLSAGFLDAEYLWSTGERDSIITISKPGRYSVEVFMENCILKDTVIVVAPKSVLSFPYDTMTCQGDSVQLSLSLPGTYLWSDGSRDKELTVLSSGHYSVTVTNECGEFYYSTLVEMSDCKCTVFVPNVFSPNGDGVNDILEVFWGCDFEYRFKSFRIFDRWGVQVYSVNTDAKVRWDGTSFGRYAPAGVYIWSLEYDVMRNGSVESRFESGDVTLLR